MADFEMFAGDSKVLEITVVDEAGDVVNITGTDIRWQLAKRATSATALIEKETSGDGISIIDGPAGRFDVAIDPADTLALKGSFYHEAEIDDGGVISTVMSGKAKIKPALIKPETP